MKCRFSLKTVFSFSEPVSGHVFRLRPLPADIPGQTVLESHVKTNSPQPLSCLKDPLTGCFACIGRFDAPHEALVVEAGGVVETSPAAVGARPAPYHLLQTPLTEPGDCIRKLFEEVRPGLHANARDDALLLMHAVHGKLVYAPGQTNTRTSAEDALLLGRGVCQDYAHVLIALLRLAGIPALYAAGLMQGTGVTHAWVQAWTGDAWLGLDPTHDAAAGEGYIVFARGCDFADAALERGVFLGGARQTIQTTAVVEELLS